jgi:hypothetical protein
MGMKQFNRSSANFLQDLLHFTVAKRLIFTKDEPGLLAGSKHRWAFFRFNYKNGLVIEPAVQALIFGGKLCRIQ